MVPISMLLWQQPWFQSPLSLNVLLPFVALVEESAWPVRNLHNVHVALDLLYGGILPEIGSKYCFFVFFRNARFNYSTLHWRSFLPKNFKI